MTMITMNAAYIITDKPETVEILKKSLPDYILQSVGITATGNPSAARSLGSTIMSERTQPVAIAFLSSRWQQPNQNSGDSIEDYGY